MRNTHYYVIQVEKFRLVRISSDKSRIFRLDRRQSEI